MKSPSRWLWYFSGRLLAAPWLPATFWPDPSWTDGNLVPVLSVFLAGTGSDPTAETLWGGGQGLAVGVTKFGGGWRCSECPAGCQWAGTGPLTWLWPSWQALSFLCAERRAQEPLCGALGEEGSLRKGPGSVIRAGSEGWSWEGEEEWEARRSLRSELEPAVRVSDQCLSEEGATS